MAVQHLSTVLSAEDTVTTTQPRSSQQKKDNRIITQIDVKF